MSYPKTKEEWWEFVDRYYDDLIETITLGEYDEPQPYRLYLDCSNEEGVAIKPAAEWETGEKISTLVSKFAKGARDKDHKLVYEALNTTWMRAPDDCSIHSRPAWGALCDLLSEAYLVYEDS